ncbi:MAG: vWA domain-containing protein [Oscillospiraceae bacterium]|nr:vWA domain-containing protein [Oscillospiraceae bacterium]
MKKWKQALALVLALVMALSLVALPSFAADEDASGSGTAASDGPAWPAEGSINLSKKAQPVDEESGLYEVTLTIQGKNYSTTSDVVLVIDCSGSMEGTKLTNTRKAAKAFGDKLLTENSTTRIAIVTFIDTATAYNSGHFYTASELDAFKKAIDKATYANGGTNQQAGIHVAQQLLASASSTGKQKNIVILSDGEPTYSHPFVATATYANCEAWTEIGCPRGGNITNIGAFTPDYNTVIGSGGAFTTSYNAYVNATCTEHGKTSRLSYGVYALDGTVTRTSGTNNGVATIWEANQAKAAGTTIFSVALQAGTEGENTLKGCASDAAKGYFAIANNDNVETKLTAAFETIAGSIAKAATNGSVTDPMSQYVNLAFTGDPKVTNSLDEYNAGGYDVYLSQGTVTRSGETLNWNVGDINEGTPAVMKYRVTLKDGLSKDRTYPTNDTTTFNYTDYQDQETSKDFEIPQVAPKGGTILMHFYLVNAQGQPINEKGVEVESPDKAKQLAAQEYYQMNGSQALEYGTYNVPMKEISGAAYYGYTLDGVTTKDVTEASVTVSTTNANREVWFAYTQSFYVAHVQMDENGQAKQVGATETYPVSAGFNLTDKVTSGYLYGGAFNSEACTEVYPFAEGETGLSFAPKAGETYYIWEVPNAYLKPMALSCWEHNTEGQLDVIGFYMVSAIDRSLYKEAGFYVNDSRTTANQMTYEAIDEARTTVASLPEGQSVAFKGITINLKQEGQSDSYTAASVVTGDKYGYMLCYGLDKDTYWPQAGESVSYYPYWVTLDGVEVTNSVTRVGTYQGTGAGKIKSNDVSRTADCTVPAVAETQLLTMASYCADGTPISTDVPTVEDVTVTVVDGAKTYELTVSAGTGVRDQVAYQAPAGKVFAGWFADQAYTIPADLDQVTEDTTIYAKYVSDSYLDLHYVRNGLFRLRGVTLISAVDNPANYQESGIIVDGVKVPVAYANRYRLFYTASGLFGAARNARLMITQQSLSGSGTLEVTPYWVTLDGTEVHGVTHTLHYNTRTIWE